MSNYKFRSEEPRYRESFPKINEVDENIDQQPYIVPIEPEPKTYRKVTTSKLRVRKTPNGEVIKVLDAGESVRVLKEHGNGWTELDNGYFVMSKFLK